MPALDQNLLIALSAWAAAQPLRAHLAVALAEDGIFLLPFVLGILWLHPFGPVQSTRRAVLAGCCAALIAIAIGLALEHVLDRPRPFVALGIPPLVPHAADSSFPSDHTLIGMALVGPLLWRRWRVGLGLALWALGVGFARVACGLHYPSDILGSAILASLPAAAGLLVADVLTARVPMLVALTGADPSRGVNPD